MVRLMLVIGHEKTFLIFFPFGEISKKLLKVEKHEVICLKTSQKKRKAFDMTKARVKVMRSSQTQKKLFFLNT